MWRFRAGWVKVSMSQGEKHRLFKSSRRCAETSGWELRCPAPWDGCVLGYSVRLFVIPRDCSLPDSSVHGILQATVLEWVAMPSFRGSSHPRGRTCIGRWVLLPLPPPGKLPGVQNMLQVFNHRLCVGESPGL